MPPGDLLFRSYQFGGVFMYPAETATVKSGGMACSSDVAVGSKYSDEGILVQIPIKIRNPRPVLTRSVSATSVRTEFSDTTTKEPTNDLNGGEGSRTPVLPMSD